jgi:hypothetical protein
LDFIKDLNLNKIYCVDNQYFFIVIAAYFLIRAYSLYEEQKKSLLKKVVI